MSKHFFKLLIVILIVLTTTSYTFAATATWDFSNAGDYTLSDTDELEVSGGSGLLVADGIPFETGSIVDDGTTTLVGAREVAISTNGNYAYVASYNDSAIEVLDISDKTNPVHVTSIVDDGTLELLNVYGVVVDGDYLYATGYADAGFQIFDISDPAAPVATGNITDNVTTRLAGAASITISGNYAYVTANSEDSLEILDISDKSNPTHVASLINSASVELDGAFGIDKVGDYVYIAGNTDDGLEIIDVSNPAAPVHAGRLQDGVGGALLDGPMKVVVSGNYAYISSYFDNAIEIVDVSDPANPTHAASIVDNGSIALAGPRSLAISGDYLYVGSFTDNGISMFDISNPLLPVHVASIVDDGTTTLSQVMYIHIDGNYLYAPSNGESGLSILDLVGSYPTTNPYITPTTANSFPYGLTSFSETLDSGNEGTVTYQVSTDNGTTWYYWNGSAWTSTTQTNGTETSSISDINTNIDTLDTDGGDFLWRAFLDSDGTQITGIDALSLVYETATVTPAIPDLNEASDTDTNDDNITKSTDLQIDLTCSAGSALTIYLDDVVHTTDTCTGGGTFSFTLTAVAVGTYEVRFTQTGTSPGDIVSATSPTLTITVESASVKRPTTRRSPEEVARIFGYTTPTTTPSVSNKELCPSNQLLTQNMKSGDRNGNYSSWQGGTITEVKILQTHMNRLGFNAGPVDGILGPLTDAAIKAMQTSLGTTPDGYVGPNTRARINTSCTPTNTSTTSLSQEALRALILQLQQQLEVLQKELA